MKGLQINRSSAKQEFESKNGTGGWDGLVKTHILKNFYAFELLMAPYAVGHLKISLLLKELGYQMGADERFELYLTNTLDMSKFQPQKELLAEEISQESDRVFEIKDKMPVLVVMGNPPYSGHSSNKGEWIERQIDEYKKVDGKPLGEKNPKWLNDDYVKFIRFAQWKIEKTGQGILGFITNHAWLDNPTFRGMRNSLLESFDEIYVLNLHGSALKKEKVPDEVRIREKIGERDEGVFGIRPGTSITLAIKNGEPKNECKVYYAEQWGSRKKKFNWLDNHDINNTDWKEIFPGTPSYLLVDRDEGGWKKYKDFVAINEISPVNSVGIVTARDKLTIGWSEGEIWNTVRQFSAMDSELARAGYKLGDDARDWKVTLAQEDLILSGPGRKNIAPILYRPFDSRYTYYTGKSRGFYCMPRGEVMKHMLKSNLALVTTRQVKTGDYTHILVSNSITESTYVSNRTSEIGYVFPLYTYNDNQIDLFSTNKMGYNINWNILPGWMATIQPFSSPVTNNFLQPPEAIFYYGYAVLYSNIYREKFQEFLKSDFPRIPFSNDYKIFQNLAILGERLVEIHLLKSKLLDNPVSRYEGKGDDRVEKRTYQKDPNRLYINETQYFDKVTPEVWGYYIGGYQVLDKWLKDRVGRVLSLEDQMHFRKVITALTQTLYIQSKIDKLYPEVEKSLIS